MERVQSLINKLSEQAKGQAPTSELLKTTELLLAELRGTAASDVLSVREGVAVWLPTGYNVRKATVVPVESEPVRITQRVETEALDEKPAEAVHVEQKPIEVKAVEAKQPEIVIEKEEVVPPLRRVPVPPPQVKVIEPDAEPVEKPEPHKEPSLFFTVQISDDDEVAAMEKVMETKPEPVTPPKPEPPTPAKPFPQYPDAATLMKNIFPLAPEPTPPPKELNQLVVDPVVQLNEKLMQKKVELAEVLAGPKITDLRKAITINDKYQMINSLFRGDEDMFERSIRTLNNFGSLPEAHFWMQRELVVKMGWNEKDDMVQHFYKLVSRRFS